MNTMNVNGQNGVATSAAIKNAVVKAVKMIDKAENGKTGYVMIGEGLRLSFNGARFIKGAKDNFIFNGKIESKGGNGRYNEVINVNYKNLDNEAGLCLNDMVNGVLDAILNYIDNTIVKYEGDDNFSLCAETLQNFRNDYFGSRLVVDNSEDFNSPDALEGPDAFTGLENASEECDGNMMACVDKYGQEFIDRVIKEYNEVVEEAVSAYGFYGFENTIKHCVKDALKDMRYYSKKKVLVGCSVVPDVVDWFVGNNFCEHFEDVYGFDWDSCQEFYKEYCDKMKSFADEYDERMVGALKDFDKESVYDKMPYDIKYECGFIGRGVIEVYIDMDDFVDFIQKNLVSNDSKVPLFNDENLGFVLYYQLDYDSEDVKQFYEDLKNRLPMVTDVAFYKDGLYCWCEDIKDNIN